MYNMSYTINYWKYSTCQEEHNKVPVLKRHYFQYIDRPVYEYSGHFEFHCSK